MRSSRSKSTKQSSSSQVVSSEMNGQSKQKNLIQIESRILEISTVAVTSKYYIIDLILLKAVPFINGLFCQKTADNRVSINYKNRPRPIHGSVCTIPKFEIDDVQVVVFGYPHDYHVALSGHRTNASIIPGF